MTPEFPRAPRSSAEAVAWAALPTVSKDCFFISAAAARLDEAHIGARVAVRDGEHVQIVDALFFRANGGGGVDDHLLKGRRINGLSHIGPNSFLQMSLNRMESTQTSTDFTSTPVVLLTT